MAKAKPIPVEILTRLKIGGKIWTLGVHDRPGMPEDLVEELEAEQVERQVDLVRRLPADAAGTGALTEDQVDAVKVAIATLAPEDLKDGVPKVPAVNKALKAAREDFTVKAADIAAVLAATAGGHADAQHAA